MIDSNALATLALFPRPIPLPFPVKLIPWWPPCHAVQQFRLIITALSQLAISPHYVWRATPSLFTVSMQFSRFELALNFQWDRDRHVYIRLRRRIQMWKLFSNRCGDAPFKLFVQPRVHIAPLNYIRQASPKCIVFALFTHWRDKVTNFWLQIFNCGTIDSPRAGIRAGFVARNPCAEYVALCASIYSPFTLFLHSHFAGLCIFCACFAHEALKCTASRETFARYILPKQTSTALFTPYMQIERSRSSLLMAQPSRCNANATSAVYGNTQQSCDKVTRVPLAGSTLQMSPRARIAPPSFSHFLVRNRYRDTNNFPISLSTGGIFPKLPVRAWNLVKIRISDQRGRPLISLLTVTWFSSRALGNDVPRWIVINFERPHRAGRHIIYGYNGDNAGVTRRERENRNLWRFWYVPHRAATPPKPEQNCGAMRRTIILQSERLWIMSFIRSIMRTVTDTPLSIMYT